MKSLKEQIEVMTHFMNGGEVECINKFMENDEYTGMTNPRWDWVSCDYRIKEEKKTVTIEKWLFFIEEENEYKIIETSNIESYRVYSSYKIIKLLETYDVEL